MFCWSDDSVVNPGHLITEVDDLIWVGQVEIILGKSEHFDELMAAAAEERELAPEEDQVGP